MKMVVVIVKSLSRVRQVCSTLPVVIYRLRRGGKERFGSRKGD